MPLNEHLAAGSIVGAFFQAERALWRLAESSRGAEVGIEVLDDVAVRGGVDGLLILEQDKSSVGSGVPLGDRSRNLWNTLGIWLHAIRDGEAGIDTTRFCLVTNKHLGECWVQRLQSAQGDAERCLQLARELRRIGRRPAESLVDYVATVIAFSEEEIAGLLAVTEVEDASSASAGRALRERIVSALHLTEGVSPEEIVQELLGWVVEETLRKVRAGEPAWLTREAFDNRLCQLIYQHHDAVFRERAARLLTVVLTAEDRERKRNDLFVRQLLLLELADDDEQLLEAIDDVLCCEIEFTRLAEDGNVTEKDVLAFQDRLSRRWRDIFRRHRRLLQQRGDLPDGAAASAGLDILSETLEHREPLAGQQTVEHYLTRGTYHQLADQVAPNGSPTLGWHPYFQTLLGKTAVAGSSAR